MSIQAWGHLAVRLLVPGSPLCRHDAADGSVGEQEVKLRRQSAGVEGSRAAEAPRFQGWAEVHFHERWPQTTQPEFLEDNLRVILRFWGARSKVDGHPDDP